MRLEACELLVTCEHGGAQVPRKFRNLFVDHGRLLQSHRSFDPGALELAKRMAKLLQAPLVANRVTRLLVDVNRPSTAPTRFSSLTAKLDARAKAAILSGYYDPHWRRVEEAIAATRSRRVRLLHVASHSFTPVLRGDRRQADVGFLYDPKRKAEAQVVDAWATELFAVAPWLRVRRNYPYAGTAPGLTTAMRRRHSERHYAGIELELNQRFVRTGGTLWLAVQAAVLAALSVALQRRAPRPRR